MDTFSFQRLFTLSEVKEKRSMKAFPDIRTIQKTSSKDFNYHFIDAYLQVITHISLAEAGVSCILCVEIQTSL